MKQLDEVLRLIEQDPHGWSKRPCETCRQISAIGGRPFGCVKKAARLPVTPQDRIPPPAVKPPRDSGRGDDSQGRKETVLSAAMVCFFKCRCGAYAVRSWVDPRQIDRFCDVCGQVMDLVGASRQTTVRLDEEELAALRAALAGGKGAKG